MQLSPNGIIVMEQWHWLGYRYPYIDLISFIIMPDHVHGIIYLDSDYYIKNVVAGMGRDPSCINAMTHLCINSTIHPCMVITSQIFFKKK